MLPQSVRSDLMKTGKDTQKTKESLVSWLVLEDGKYFHHFFTLVTFQIDGVFNVVVFVYRRQLFPAKRLNIFSSTTDKDGDASEVGNNEFGFVCIKITVINCLCLSLL